MGSNVQEQTPRADGICRHALKIVARGDVKEDQAA
jgi:hypothetical protein